MKEERINFKHSQFLDLAEQLDSSFPHLVRRFVLPLISRDRSQVRPLGTGFLIAPHLLVTARHVIDAEVERALRGEVTLEALYLSDQEWPEQQGTWGAALKVRHISLAKERVGHDLALLTIEFPYLPDGQAARPNALPLRFTAPDVGSSVLVLGYSEMLGGAIDEASDHVTIPHSQRLHASQGRIEQLHMPQRDAAMLTFPVLQSDYASPHGMSGGPVIAEDGAVIGVVCSSLDQTDNSAAVSFASLLAPLLSLSTNPVLADPPEFETLWDLLEEGVVIRGDGTHRHYPRPPWGSS